MKNKNIDAVIVASGRGERAHTNAHSTAKQYHILADKAVLTHAIEAFLLQPQIRFVQVVINEQDGQLFEDLNLKSEKLLPPVFGGQTRQISVHNGLQALKSHQTDIVLIHDGARPNIKSSLINAGLHCFSGNTQWAGVVPTTAVAQTTIMCTQNGEILQNVPRENLFSAQTPQIFNFNIILDAIDKKIKNNENNFTDESTLLLSCGHNVGTFAGCPDNIKYTTPFDYDQLEHLMTPKTQTRTGYGYDIHHTQAGDHVTLCGVRIPAPFALNGHSDADVALHALTDALLGTIGDGDIGLHFKNTDPRWKNAASTHFVEFALSRLALRNAKLLHVDINIIAQEPKIAPFRSQMLENLSQMLNLSQKDIGLKATTAEGIGAIGRMEGLSATALATISLPIKGA